MYKNIIFDLGGVMVHWDPKEYLMEMFHNPVIERKVYDTTFGSKEWLMADAGEISRFAADNAMLDHARAAGYSFEVQEVIDHWPNILRTRRDVVDIAAQLKAQGFRLYCLSNIASDTAALLRRRSFWRLFDGHVLSCDINRLKPDPAIYNALLEQYHLNPAECIFIDDNEANVRSAHKLGITSILMTSEASDLVKNLGICGIHVG